MTPVKQPLSETSAETRTAGGHLHFARFLTALGLILCLGGVAHFFGVLNLYRTKPLPLADRILLDFWIGEAQIVGGGFYIAAGLALRREKPWRMAAIGGALSVLGFALPYIPVLISRAPPFFQIPAEAYSFMSLFVLYRAARSQGPRVGGSREVSEPPAPKGRA